MWQLMSRKSVGSQPKETAAAGKRSKGIGPKRGRPRSAKAEEAILDATLALLAEGGMSALTVEGVAARAGVGKATIYRRWPSKLPLVVEAITTLPEIPAPGIGTVRDDLRQMIRSLVRIFQSSPRGRVLAQLAAERGADAEVDAAVGRFVTVRRRPLVEVMRRGIKQGELPTDVDPEALTDMVVGPVINRLLFSRRRADVRFIDRVIDNVLIGSGAADLTKSSGGGSV
jgi:AcrR family transcriptional regulator